MAGVVPARRGAAKLNGIVFRYFNCEFVVMLRKLASFCVHDGDNIERRENVTNNFGTRWWYASSHIGLYRRLGFCYIADWQYGRVVFRIRCLFRIGVYKLEMFSSRCPIYTC